MTDPLFGDVIHAYTRAEALEDGVLADLTPWAQEAGFRWPLAVTQGVWSILAEGNRWVPSDDEYETGEPDPAWAGTGQSCRGRAQAMFAVLRQAAHRTPSGSDRIEFSPLFLRQPDGAPEPVRMVAASGPGDQGEPVITVMLPGED